MTSALSFISRFRFHALTLLSVSVAVLIFRAYLLPNTFPGSFDRWIDVDGGRFGFPSASFTAVAACAVAAAVWLCYMPAKSRDSDVMGLWLTVGGWLGLNVATILTSLGDQPLLTRDTEFLIAYALGLCAARLFRRLDGYVTALIIAGAIQSIIAIIDHSKGLHILVSGNVIRAGGTFNSPSILYLVPIFILPLAVERVLQSESIRISCFYMVCSASIFAALVLTWERTGFAAVCLALFWLVRRYLTGKRQAIGLAVVLVLICGVFFVRANGPINHASSMRSIDSRSHLFKVGILTFGHHWIQGVGIGNLTLPVPVKINNVSETIQMTQPYNQILYWLDEMGLSGGVLIGLLSIFIYSIVFGRRSVAARGIGAVWLGVLIAGLFNTIFGYYELSCGNMLIGSLLGMTMRLHEVAPEPKKVDENICKEAIFAGELTV